MKLPCLYVYDVTQNPQEFVENLVQTSDFDLEDR